MKITQKIQITFCLLAVFFSTAIFADPLKGIAYLAGANQAIDSATLADPNVGSVVLRTHWSTVEPIQGKYDWRYYDTQVAKVKPLKAFSIGIAAGDAVPPWLYSSGVKPFAYLSDGAIVTVPLPSDDIYVDKYISAIKSMGERFAASNPASVYAPCAALKNGDWLLTLPSTDIKNMQAMGFTTQKLIDNCIKIIDATMTAFPTSTVRMPIGPTPTELLQKGQSSMYPVDTIIAAVEAKWPGRLMALSASASVSTPDAIETKSGKWLTMKTTTAQKGFQALWMVSDITSCKMNGKKTPCDPAAMLKETVRIMKTYGIGYGELYAADKKYFGLVSLP